jgi:hypothetical protein
MLIKLKQKGLKQGPKISHLRWQLEERVEVIIMDKHQSVSEILA